MVATIRDIINGNYDMSCEHWLKAHSVTLKQLHSKSVFQNPAVLKKVMKRMGEAAMSARKEYIKRNELNALTGFRLF